MKSRMAKSLTADLFAAADPSAARIPAPAPEPGPTPAAIPAAATSAASAMGLAPRAAPLESAPGLAPRAAPWLLRTSGGVPPVPRTASPPRSNQLWYAVVFPELMKTQPSPVLLQRLCMVAQQFTSSVSIEMPNALLLDIKGSVKLFGSLGRLHAGIDAAWSRLALDAHSATAPSTLAAL